jgi:hypothetical protein
VQGRHVDAGREGGARKEEMADGLAVRVGLGQIIVAWASTVELG